MNEYDRQPDGYDTLDEHGEPLPMQDSVKESPAYTSSNHVTPTSVFCVECGYNLTGVAIGSTCPECGRTVAPSFHSQMLPTSGKAVAALVLGICSIPLCLLYGIPSIVCGILAIVFNRKAKAQVVDGKVNPASKGMATAGLICGIIGLCLGISYIVIIVGIVVMTRHP